MHNGFYSDMTAMQCILTILCLFQLLSTQIVNYANFKITLYMHERDVIKAENLYQ